jgi:hypothetical protein
MPQWGSGGSATNATENKPQNETEYQKSKTFADQRGWVYQREDGTEEVLVAIRGLSGSSADLNAKLGTSNLTQAFLLTSTLKADTTGVLRVVWNERITPTTTGTAVVRNFTSGSNITATRQGNTSSNFIDYYFAVPNQAGINLGIQAQTITQGAYDATGAATTSDLVIAAGDIAYAGLNSRHNAASTSYVVVSANTGTAIVAAWFRSASYSTGTTGTVRVYWADPVKYVTTGTLNIVASGTSTVITARNALVAVSSNFVDFTFTVPATTGTVLTISSTQTIAAAIYNANTVGNTYTSVLVITSGLIAPAGSDGTAFGTGPLPLTAVTV